MIHLCNVRKPTSSNISFCKSIDIVPGETVTFLDVEGKDGGNVFPSTETQSDERNFFEKTKLTEDQYFDIRNRTVEEIFPKLAYLSSEVIIYVSNLDLGNRNYRTEVMTTLQEAAFKLVVITILNGWPD
jgi:hypothetical protein